MLKYLITVIITIISISIYLHKDTTIIKGKKAYYSTSNSCKECHNGKHEAWSNSLHPKIFKPYTNDTQIVADFKNKPDFVKFDKKDIEVIIGGKWEQVFARKIEGEYYPFPAKWMVLTQEWIPYKTKDWNKTPLTQKCNGCHTTGLDKQTGEFSEWGVSCESCHGPASTHVQNKKMLTQSECTICHNSDSLVEELNKKEDIIVSVKSAVCGQCHSRGKEKGLDKYHTEVQFNFPVEYLPGQNLSQNFKPTTPQTDKKGKNWWGNGISKNRHQEYADFNRSKHASSLKNLKEKKNTKCAQQPKDSCLQCHSADYILAPKDNKPTLQTAKLGITCVVCHNPHSLGEGKRDANQPSSGCGNCHIGNMSFNVNKLNQKHYPCPTNEVSCADCHMPRIVKTGGKFSLRSHAFKIIPPEATKKYGMPNSCQNGSCHADKPLEWAQEEYSKFYPKEKKTLRQSLKDK